MDLWQLISNESINISYTEAMNMDKTERICAYAAVMAILKKREKQMNKK